MKANRLTVIMAVLFVMVGNIFADNLTVESVTMSAGETKQISIVLNNPDRKYAAFQFDLVLPDGITIIKNSNGKLMVSLVADRIDDHTLNVSEMGDNTYRLLSFSLSNTEFYDTSGALLNITLKADANISSGNKTAMLKSQVFTAKNGTQYKWNDLSFNIQIKAAVIPEVMADNKSREYGENNPTLTYTASAELNGVPSLTTSATKTSPVGDYEIVVGRGSIQGDYKSKNGKLTVTKAPLTISAENYTIKQGDPLPTFVAKYSGFKESVLSQKPKFSTLATSNSSPGTYQITVYGASANNYDISYVTGTLTITKADAVTVTARSYTREYGGTPQITCSATKTSPVGTYTIKISKGSVSNYNVTYVDGTLTITKAPLTITAKSYTREEGTANPTLEATYNGFKNSETEYVLSRKPTLTTTATIDSQPGVYTITASNAEAQNYQMSYVSGILTVTEKKEVKFTTQGISYIGTNANRTAEVEGVSVDIVDLEIPQSVTYGGKTYQVTSVKNGALSNRKFNYVSLPSTINSLNANTFYNSVLGALIWKADASLPSSVFTSMWISTKSNFLLYVNSESYAPSNVSNVIVGSTAQSITLTDGTSTRFYCPRAFTAQSITYTHHSI